MKRPVFDYAGRVSAMQALMAGSGLDAMVLSVGADLPYLTGYEAMPSERLTMLVIKPTGGAVLFIPDLEVARVESENVEIVGWGELDDPIALVATELGSVGRVAVGDHTWSAFLIGLQSAVPGVDWTAASPFTADLRTLKDPSEIEALRSAAAAVDRALDRLPGEVPFAGRTEAEIALDLRRMTVEEGHHEASFAIVASGPNAASPHHEPGARIVEQGDLVVCDFGGRLSGYCSDVTRTFSVGEPGAEEKEVHGVVREANLAGRRAVAPGVSCEQVDRATRQVVEAAGYGEWFIHRTGHGIGLEVHEHPYIVEGNQTALRAGMCFSIEPGIYLPGRFGVRIEDIVACGGEAVDDLNDADRALVVVA